ncbi:MAG: hypothetical protein ACW96S_08760 [Promethearchaeota archaeon]
MKLSKEEQYFLDLLDNAKGNHATETYLRRKLKDKGIEEEDFINIKRKLIFSGYIGSVYGNIILETKACARHLSDK